jgi:hypothetical protein
MATHKYIAKVKTRTGKVRYIYKGSNVHREETVLTMEDIDRMPEGPEKQDALRRYNQDANVTAKRMAPLRSDYSYSNNGNGMRSGSSVGGIRFGEQTAKPIQRGGVNFGQRLAKWISGPGYTRFKETPAQPIVRPHAKKIERPSYTTFQQTTATEIPSSRIKIKFKFKKKKHENS